MRVRNAINSITLAPAQSPLERFLEAGGVPEDERGRQDDPDRDGLVNLLEFYLGTEPNEQESSPATRIEVVDETPFFIFTQSAAAVSAGVTFEVLYGDNPGSIDPFALSLSDVGETALSDGRTEIRIPLPEEARGFAALRVTLAE